MLFLILLRKYHYYLSQGLHCFQALVDSGSFVEKEYAKNTFLITFPSVLNAHDTGVRVRFTIFSKVPLA